MTNNDWYCHYAPRWLSGLTAEQISADRAAAMIDLDAVLARTGLCPADRILEVGCGWGRHSLALAQRGFSQVISIDIAPELLARGAALARAEGLSCRFRHQNFTQVEDGPFAAILSLYDRSVCGFPTEAEDRHSLQHLARLLVLGGWLVFGINDWPQRLPTSSCIQQPTCDGVEVREVVSDPAVMVCTQRTTQLHADGSRDLFELTRRHYGLSELRCLLEEAGFGAIVALHRLAPERSYGDGGDGLFIYARRTT